MFPYADTMAPAQMHDWVKHYLNGPYVLQNKLRNNTNKLFNILKDMIHNGLQYNQFKNL